VNGTPQLSDADIEAIARRVHEFHVRRAGPFNGESGDDWLARSNQFERFAADPEAVYNLLQDLYRRGVISMADVQDSPNTEAAYQAMLTRTRSDWKALLERAVTNFACPSCGAVEGEPCRTKNGGVNNFPHTPRRRLAGSEE
jgi:hypothetical protein